MQQLADPNASLTILQILQSLQQGQLLNDVGSKLRDICRDVIQTEKGGEVTIKLRIDTVKKSNGAVVITAEVTDKAPKHPPLNDIFFMGREFTFHRNSQQQRDLFGPRAVDSTHDVDPETGEILNRNRQVAIGTQKSA